MANTDAYARKNLEIQNSNGGRGWVHPRSFFDVRIGNSAGEDMAYQQVNSRLLISFPAARVFEFRVGEGILSSLQFIAPDNVGADVIFDVKKGTRSANLASIFENEEDRPKISAGSYLVSINPALACNNNDLISVTVVSASENLRFLTCRAEVSAE